LNGLVKWGLGEGGKAVTFGLVQLPTMAAMDLAQNWYKTGTPEFSSRYLAGFGKHGIAGELLDEFAAGVLGAGVRRGVELGGHGLVDAGRRLPGMADLRAGRADVWQVRAGELGQLRDAAVVRTLGARAEALNLRELEVAARERAAGADTGVERQVALTQAHQYATAAGRADARAGVHQAEAVSFAEASARAAQRSEVLAAAVRPAPASPAAGGAGPADTSPSSGGVDRPAEPAAAV